MLLCFLGSLGATLHVAVPLSTRTDGGCDTQCTQRKAWSRQIATLELATTDFLIASAEHVGTQELWNVLTHKSVRNLLYVGVHENMCIMFRLFCQSTSCCRAAALPACASASPRMASRLLG